MSLSLFSEIDRVMYKVNVLALHYKAIEIETFSNNNSQALWTKTNNTKQNNGPRDNMKVKKCATYSIQHYHHFQYT